MKKAGVNQTMPKGPQAKGRINPNSFNRNNLAKGGVNKHLGGTKSK